MFSANTAQVSSDKLYVDDVFSTYLYTGNGSTQTINNGIDLAGKGGLVWMKDRSAAANHYLCHSSTTTLYSNTTAAAGGSNATFLANGFTDTRYSASGNPQSSWTFRKAPKFFDVVTYTGDGSGFNREVPHSLGSQPGFVVIKRTDSTSNWWVAARYSNGTYAIGNGTTDFALNSTNAASAVADATGAGGIFGSGTFKPAFIAQTTTANASGGTYVAYLFAHDTSTDGLIQCGSYTGNGSATGPVINLGWEPQFVIIKRADSTSSWTILDQMRGFNVGTTDAFLWANLSNAEVTDSANDVEPTATGFQPKATGSSVNALNGTYIYLAIRRPNKPPTTGTQVYNAIARTGTGAAATVTGVGFAPDLVINRRREASGGTQGYWMDRLRGASAAQTPALTPSASGSESSYTSTDTVTSLTMTGMTVGSSSYANATDPLIHHFFRRAPGFFDVVCYTGTGVARTMNHNLGVVPELMIVKCRSAGATDWRVYSTTLGQTGGLILQSNGAGFTGDTVTWNNTNPTASVFSLGSTGDVNASGQAFVAHLFATLPGISKVGSYTGNGSSQTINCGFSTGARFILIKRTDSTGDWYVWDSARGIVAANDPHLSLNTTAAEVTTDDSVDPDNSGFIVNQVAATNINVNAASYIYLAIA